MWMQAIRDDPGQYWSQRVRAAIPYHHSAGACMSAEDRFDEVVRLLENELSVPRPRILKKHHIAGDVTVVLEVPRAHQYAYEGKYFDAPLVCMLKKRLGAVVVSCNHTMAWITFP